MFDVLKTAHELGMEIVPRTKSYTKFVKLYDALCGQAVDCYWGIKLLGDGLEDWEIQHLQNRGLNVPRPDIVIGRGDPMSRIPLEALKPKDPVFFLTKIEDVDSSFTLMIESDGPTIEGCRGDALWRVRRETPEFRISKSGFEYGSVPEPLRRLWAKASMVNMPKGIAIIYEGWLKKNGDLEMYDAEIAPLKS